MLETLSPRANDWLSLPAEVGVGLGGSIAIIGLAASEMAEVYQAAGAGPIVHDAPGLAVIATEEVTVTADGTLPAESLGTVLLRHAWSERAAFNQAVAAAHRACRPGGALVVMEPDLDRLMESPPRRFPSRLQFDLRPGLLADARRRTVGANDIAVELVRLRCQDVGITSLDELAGDVTVAEYVATLGQRWPGISLLGEDDRAALAAEAAPLLERMAQAGRLIDREPWVVARGFKAA